jgi:hypothetical protein
VIELYDTQLEPEIRDALDNGPLMSVSNQFWQGERRPGRPLDHSTMVAVPNTQGLRNLIRLRATIVRAGNTDLTSVRNELEQLLALIRSNLEDGA